MNTNPRPSLAGLAEKVQYREATRKKLSELSGAKHGLLLDYWRGFLPYFLRGSFYSLVQALELFLLIRLDFFFLPSGSLRLLTLLSVGHTAALCLAFSLRRLPQHPQFQGHDGKGLLQSLILDLSVLFFLCSLLALSLLTFSSDLHFSSPPIYRAMISTWFLALPLEAGIMMGLFTSAQRSVILKRGSITRIQVLQTLVGCLAIFLHFPLLYLGSYLLGLLCCLRLLFPDRSLVKTSRSSAHVLLSLVRRAFPATSIELAGKLLYLPLAFLDPSFGFLSVVMQRLMHVTSAVGLRISDLSQKSFLRHLAYGGPSLRALGLSRVRRLFLWALPLLLLLALPVVLIKNSVFSWSSPYDERLHFSPLAFLILLGITFGRAYLSSQVRLLDECEFAAQRTHPLRLGRVWGLFFGILSLGSALLLAKCLPAQFPGYRVGQLFLIFLCSDAMVLLFQLLVLRLLFLKLWRSPWGSHYRWVGKKEQTENLWLLEADYGHSLKSSSENAVRWSEKHLLLGLPQAETPLSRSDAIHFECYQLFSSDDLLRGDELGLFRLFQAGYSGKAELGPANLEFHKRELEGLLPYLSPFQGSLEERAARIFPYAELLSIEEVLFQKKTEIDPTFLQYLDLLSARGALIPIRGGRKSLRGLTHLNEGILPRYLLRLPVDKREFAQSYSYKAFLLNVLSAQHIS